MHYTQLFRQFREARDLSHETLARRAGCHRNTVINVERGRPVKFRTLAGLMDKMGYGSASPELRALALLWLEAVSGLPFSRPETAAAARKQIATFGRESSQAARLLGSAVAAEGLTAQQIALLGFAARRPEVLTILGAVKRLVESGTDEETEVQLKVAEDK